MSAGWYRATAPMLTPSAAYGLLLNVACVETRLREEDEGHSGSVPSSLTRPDLPALRLAIGVPEGIEPPRVQTIYQQLHNYPVGKDAGVPAEWTKGNKNNISPVRREYLSNLRVVLCADGNPEIEDRIRRGLAGEFNSQRYGLPFIGDNSFFLQKAEVLSVVPPCHWYEQVGDEADSDRLPLTARLTVWIDRAVMARTVSKLFAPTAEATNQIPNEAWTWIQPP